MYGLREAPSLWSEERTKALTKLTFTSEGEPYSVLLSQIHRSLRLIVRQRSLHDDHVPFADHLGPSSECHCRKLLAWVTRWVALTLMTFSLLILLLWSGHFWRLCAKMWKMLDLQYLTMDAELPFLGVSIRMTKNGLLLQHHYTLDFLREHSSHISARKRTTSGEPEHLRRNSFTTWSHNFEHQNWVKIGQKILGRLLWLSTRTRPDLSYSVPSASQVLTKDIELLKVKLRHLHNTSTLDPRIALPIP